jgi:hypothetical protein
MIIQPAVCIMLFCPELDAFDSVWDDDVMIDVDEEGNAAADRCV